MERRNPRERAEMPGDSDLLAAVAEEAAQEAIRLASESASEGRRTRNPYFDGSADDAMREIAAGRLKVPVDTRDGTICDMPKHWKRAVPM